VNAHAPRRRQLRQEGRRLPGGIGRAIALLTALLLAAVPATPASAAPGQLTEVTGFGTNPGNLRMFEWIPADLPANAPVVVVLHGCFSSAASYDTETGLAALADQANFALVLPQQKSTNSWDSCFSWWKPEDHTRGQGEALSVKQMVDWMQTNRGIDPSRVYVMGHSGGGLFTSVMLATYPDVFKAGAIVAGGAYKCGTQAACTNGSATKTPQEWGDLARSGHPGYVGSKPPVSIFHGSSDTTMSYVNFTEVMEQWTNFHGIDQTAEVNDTVRGYPHKVYKNAGGASLVETYSLTGKGHGWPLDPGTQTDQCSGATPGADYDICASYYATKWFGIVQ
jgi:poly(hydroxyalkanoate) depolymerase family esterase